MSGVVGARVTQRLEDARAGAEAYLSWVVERPAEDYLLQGAVSHVGAAETSRLCGALGTEAKNRLGDGQPGAEAYLLQAEEAGTLHRLVGAEGVERQGADHPWVEAYR